MEVTNFNETFTFFRYPNEDKIEQKKFDFLLGHMSRTFAYTVRDSRDRLISLVIAGSRYIRAVICVICLICIKFSSQIFELALAEYGH